MSKTYFIKEATLIDIGDAIRSKTGDSAKIPANQIANVIRNQLDGNTHEFINGTISYINDDKITMIKPYAFYDCNELHTVIVPNASSVGTYGFYSCEKLSTLYAPKATSVAGNGLAGCASLVDVTLGITGNLLSTDTVGTYLTTKTTLKRAIFPECPRISDSVFRNCYNLSEITFPKASFLGSWCFAGNSAASILSFPAAATVQTGAFYSCKALKELYLPEATNIAGSRAFEQCPELHILDMPKCTAMNASGCFTESPNLSWVRVGFSTTVSNAFAGKAMLSYFEASQGVTLATGCLLNCYSLTKVSFPMAKTIGSTAFQNCYQLSSFTFPEVTKISDAAFSNCSAITQMNDNFFPQSALTINTLAFQKCTNLSKVTLTCQTVGLNAFTGCTNLTQLDLTVPSLTVVSAMSSIPITTLSLRNCSTVADYMFLSCHKLQSVYIYGATNLKGTGIFQDCSALTTVSAPECTVVSYATFNRCAISSIYLPACTTIGRIAFGTCKNLTHVDLPACTTFYYSNTASFMGFYNCTALEYVRLGGVVTMSSMLLQNFTTVKSVKLDNCTTLNANCFSGMKGLISASLPKVATVNATCFYDCIALPSINLPAAVTVQKLAFQNCSAMTKASIPLLTTLAAQAFQNCYALSQFTIPATVSIIQPSTFLNCSALTSLRIEGSTLKTLSAANAFGGTPLSVSTLTGNFGSIYVPASLYASYIAATNWKTYSARMVSY